MNNQKTIEILKTAILLEKRGESFYRKVAQETEFPEVAHIFTTMADEEVMHARLLSEKYKEANANKPLTKPDFPVASEEGVVNTILSEDLKSKISAAGFEAAAISAAIDMENKAIEVYSGRAESAEDANEKELFSWLADWERTHHKILYDLDTDLKERVWNDNHFWPF
jgi:rubrerythrin